MADRKLALALVCLVLLCGAALTEAGCKERPNWNLKGSKGLIKTTKWKKGVEKSPVDCCNKCKKNKKCKKWTFFTTKSGDGCSLYTSKAVKYKTDYTAVSGDLDD